MSDTYLGIDIGGTYIKWGVIDAAGEILRMGVLETKVEEGVEYFLDHLYRLTQEHKDVLGVGICTAGIVDSRCGVVVGGIENIPYLKGLELRALLEKHTGKPVRVLNDVRAAALGENWMGAGKGCENLFCITIGTGLGGALMQKGQLYEGAHFHAGEIGYMRYRPDGSCLEQGYSARALMQKASETLGQAALTPNAFFDLVVEKDPDAVRIYHEWIDGLAQSLADILLITDPEKLVIGGGITERGPLLLKPLKRAIQARLPQEMAEHFSVELAQCGNSAGMLGAVNYLMAHASPENKTGFPNGVHFEANSAENVKCVSRDAAPVAF